MGVLDILYKQIQSVHVIEDAIWADMSQYWHEIEIGRKQVLTRVGDIERYLYFVVSGIQRAYVEKRGKESTLVFSYTNSFSGIIDSLLLQVPSAYCLETLTKSHFLRIHYNDFNRLLQQHRELDTWARVALTHTLAGTLERNIELLSFSAEERFKTLLRRSPHVLNMIPHKYLASYIGVDPTTFSKMLSTVKIQ